GVLQAGGDEPIDTETLFSVGSVSKVGTAVLILKLLEEGSVNIDEDVNQYLSSWQVPENEYTREQAVTLRHIMSHTAGLTVHGFADFYPGEEQPTTVQILDGVSPAKSAPVRVNIPVGSQFRYSGGGTTVSQLVIEDQTGVCFDQAAKDILFEPLQMTRSSYQNPLPASVGNIAKAHNPLGMAVALPRGYQSMPEAAASGLWTNPTEFSKLMIMLMETYAGNSSYLSQATVQDMMTPVTPSIYGLGPQIKQTESSILFMHGGSNDSYRARFVGDLSSQNGVIIFTNGTNGSALINELWPVFKPLL
ncbi:MAG TPA: serine hydrolase, partial [Cytophagales bacterium]|nr:serine hydrolase [Cytophagales bacterium]